MPDLSTPAVVPAHPAAVMLALIAGKLQAKMPLQKRCCDGDGASFRVWPGGNG